MLFTTFFLGLTIFGFYLVFSTLVQFFKDMFGNSKFYHSFVGIFGVCILSFGFFGLFCQSILEIIK